MIWQQIELAVISYIIGIIIGLLYFVLYLIEKKINIRLLAKIIVDFVFWESAAFFTAYTIYMINEGSVRGFAVMGIFLGFLTVYKIVA